MSVKNNVTFGCYAFLGLSSTVFALAMTLTEGQEQAGWGMLLGLSLPVPVLGAFITSIVLTLWSPRKRLLLFLCLIHILFIAMIVLIAATHSGKGDSEAPVDAAFLVYGGFFTLVSIWWFISGRQRFERSGSLG